MAVRQQGADHVVDDYEPLMAKRRAGTGMDDHATGGAAFGGPGMEPKWARGAKDGVGTAYAASSRVWFTVWNGGVGVVDRSNLASDR
jgi:hypothetical protein